MLKCTVQEEFQAKQSLNRNENRIEKLCDMRWIAPSFKQKNYTALAIRIIIAFFILLPISCSKLLDDSVDLGSHYRLWPDFPQTIIYTNGEKRNRKVFPTTYLTQDSVVQELEIVEKYNFNDKYIIVASRLTGCYYNTSRRHDLHSISLSRKDCKLKYWIIDKSIPFNQLELVSMDSLDFYRRLDSMNIQLEFGCWLNEHRGLSKFKE